MREAVGVGALVFALAAPLAYVTERVIERAQSGFPDPTLVLSGNHVAFYWRAGTATWWGGLAAAIVSVVLVRTRRDGRAAARVLGLVAIPLVLVLAALAWRLP